MSIKEKIQGEPILLTGLAAAIILLVTNFGVDLSDGQQGAIIGVVVAVSAFFGRSKVSPIS